MSTTDEIFQYLQGQGLQPNKTDFGIAFKYQMCNFLIFHDENDDLFLSLALPGIYDVNDDNMLDALMAANEVNNHNKVIKVVINDGNTWVMYESLLDSTPVYDDIIPRALGMLMGGRQTFYDALKK
jgi:hypothetical protein